MKVDKKCNISAQYLQNYACYCKKHREIPANTTIVVRLIISVKQGKGQKNIRQTINRYKIFMCPIHENKLVGNNNIECNIAPCDEQFVTTSVKDYNDSPIYFCVNRCKCSLHLATRHAQVSNKLIYSQQCLCQFMSLLEFKGKDCTLIWCFNV